VKALEKSYALKKEIGDKAGMIAAKGNLANVLDDEGDLPGAQRCYEEVLQLSRDIGNKRFEAVTIGNLANIRAKRGEIPQALEDFHRAIELSRQIGNKFSTLWQLAALTEALIESGDLASAEKSANEDLEMARTAGENASIADALQIQGDIAFKKADLSTAHQRYQDALSLYRKEGDKNAEAQLAYEQADLALEQGNLTEAEQLARQSILELDKEKAQKASVAHAVLAHVLLAQGAIKGAQNEISQARATSGATHDLTVSNPVQIIFARVQARNDPSAATEILQKLIDHCRKQHLVDDEFEARLAMGEIQLGVDSRAGRSTLQSLKDEAGARGFLLTVNRAAAALKRAH
jgi:tetratricopeptide (TPR) repeat protein